MIKDKMIEWAIKYNTRDFIQDDPVQFIHRFTDPRDIEIAGFIVSWISWGRRTMIINKGKELMNIMNGHPYDFIMREDYKIFKHISRKIYRTFSYGDFHDLCVALRRAYVGYGSLGDKMRMYANCRYDHALRQMFGHCNGIPDVFSKSAAKRINMFLRWMVRKDEVDVGIWGGFLDKSKLLIPIDTHVLQMALTLGITDQVIANEKAMLQITEYFKAIFPGDPCMGDFALFGYGVNNIKIER